MLQTFIDSLTVTVFALGIFFAALVIIMFLIMLKNFMQKDKRSSENENIMIEKAVPVMQSTPVQKQIQTDSEIAAAIVAAICSYTNLSSNEFTIKSIKRVNGNDSSWRNAGIIQ